jgi:DNA-directed RNA polymerase subunit RPC12/RpoP
MPTLTREIRTGASARADGTACLLTETRVPRCPVCSSGAIAMAPGHILADATGMIRLEYRCDDCGAPFWLLQEQTLLSQSMNEEAILREYARGAIRAGTLLAARRPDRIWAGSGAEAPCAVCERPIRRHDLELEIQFAHGGAATPGMDKFHLHLRCFAAWELERHLEGV